MFGKSCQWRPHRYNKQLFGDDFTYVSLLHTARWLFDCWCQWCPEPKIVMRAFMQPTGRQSIYCVLVPPHHSSTSHSQRTTLTSAAGFDEADLCRELGSERLEIELRALSKDQETIEVAIWNIYIFVVTGVPTGAVHRLQSDPFWYRDKREHWRAMFV